MEMDAHSIIAKVILVNFLYFFLNFFYKKKGCINKDFCVSFGCLNATCHDNKMCTVNEISCDDNNPCTLDLCGKKGCIHIDCAQHHEHSDDDKRRSSIFDVDRQLGFHKSSHQTRSFSCPSFCHKKY